MHKQGHFGLGLLSTSVLTLLLLEGGFFLWAPLIGLAGIAGGLTPDIDNKQIVPFKHHGWTHTVVFGLFISAIISGCLFGVFHAAIRLTSGTTFAITSPPLLGNLALAILLYVGTLAGFLSHLFGDTLSTAGGTLLIRPWKPISNNHVRIGVTTAGNPVYNLAFFLLGVISHILPYYVYL
ncbi:metal-dependent hydrolase [Haloarcula sp. Atlit-7R]|uniref:metal-dependent hydrolase n=1 Tax=Haloarcula sp. Atlit-7R TaxID=2282125 RepID=UPI000EF164ED|nr:metal-dependent hydrolase [Haloarcula sp. Atlit-7R]RLM94350.1 hypothetical protein D3D01_15930 [Haloarcula sp. Atlit-7R]